MKRLDIIASLEMQIHPRLMPMMTLTPTTLALIAVLIIGYLAAIGFGTLAYFANKQD